MIQIAKMVIFQKVPTYLKIRSTTTINQKHGQTRNEIDALLMLV